ncbi:hypothetical protein AFAE65S_03693 [Alcaligenes phenolicus]
MFDLTNMQVRQSAAILPSLAHELTHLGALLASLRHARRGVQKYGVSNGELGLTIGQVLRYLDAIAPGATLADLLAESDPALSALQRREATQRVRDRTAAERAALDF